MTRSEPLNELHVPLTVGEALGFSRDFSVLGLRAVLIANGIGAFFIANLMAHDSNRLLEVSFFSFTYGVVAALACAMATYLNWQLVAMLNRGPFPHDQAVRLVNKSTLTFRIGIYTAILSAILFIIGCTCFALSKY